MISWRYHVVSIVAVVLAFGLGILAGTSVVNDEFVKDLQQNTNEAQEQRDEALARAALYERFAEALQPILRDGALVGADVIVVTMEGVDRPARRTADELTAAGADVLATLELTHRLVEPDATEGAAALREIVGTTSSDAAQLRVALAEALADRLAFGSGPDDDVLETLLAEGFVTADRDLDHAALGSIGGVDQTIVLAVGDGEPADVPPPDVFLLPLTERLVDRGASVAVVGPQDDGYGLVGAVRDTSAIADCSLVTVDDIDLSIGGIALAMGLDRLLDDADPAFRPGGDYGVGTDDIVPGEPPASCRR